MHYPYPMDQDEKELFAETIMKRIEMTPDDWYISDDGKVLYALLAGSYLWSMRCSNDANFHKMTDAKIVLEIQTKLRELLE